MRSTLPRLTTAGRAQSRRSLSDPTYQSLTASHLPTRPSRTFPNSPTDPRPNSGARAQPRPLPRPPLAAASGQAPEPAPAAWTMAQFADGTGAGAWMLAWSAASSVAEALVGAHTGGEVQEPEPELVPGSRAGSTGSPESSASAQFGSREGEELMDHRVIGWRVGR